jgi:hypothetical protein
VTTESFAQLDLAEGLTSPEYLVPASVLEPIPSGTRLMWQVQSFYTDGGQELSKTFYLTLQ